MSEYTGSDLPDTMEILADVARREGHAEDRVREPAKELDRILREALEDEKRIAAVAR